MISRDVLMAMLPEHLLLAALDPRIRLTGEVAK